MKRKRKILLKCDVFGAGTAISGGLQAAGNVGAAMITADASNYAADQAYQGALATNQANIDIANKNNATLLQNQREINAANLQLAQQQNQWNLEQWNRQNEYNSPANQMKLYKEAGLNPVLAQGNFSPAQELMSADMANQQAVGSLQQPNLINPAADSSNIRLQGALSSAGYLKGAVSDAVDTAKKLAELDKVKADTNAVKTLTPVQYNEAVARISKISTETHWLAKTSEAEIMKVYNECDAIIATTQKTNADKELSVSQKQLVVAQTTAQNLQNSITQHAVDTLKQIPDAQLKLYFAQAFAASAQGNLTEWETKFNEEHHHPATSGWIGTIVDHGIGAAYKVLPQFGNFIKSGGLKRTGKKAQRVIMYAADKLHSIVKNPDKLKKLLSDKFDALF